MSKKEVLTEQEHRFFTLFWFFLKACLGGTGLIALVLIVVFDFNEIITKNKFKYSIASSVLTIVFCVGIYLCIEFFKDWDKQEEIKFKLNKRIFDDIFDDEDEDFFEWEAFTFDLVDLFNRSDGDYILKDDFWEVWKKHFKGDQE